ncbi:MAG: double-strand break repair protein AddB [Proteobacteria bacterium]|nr:double-strand break repair protein AddB [Pseudomonadota bacterium]
MSNSSLLKPSVFNIPPEFSFLDVLAKELLRRHGASQQELGSVTILTTTRRAARALQNAFLRETAGRPLILPRMRPIGDVEEDELLLEGEPGVGGAGETVLTLPPAIDTLRRQLLLSRLIQARSGDREGIAQAASLAKELARLLDQVHTEGLDLADLKHLVPAEYAEHWQITLEFLEILSRAWPLILEEEGCIDPSRRRDLLLRAQALHWKENPIEDPVYAVGSTGSIPATAELLKTVAGLPNGTVILPGLDRHLDDVAWEAVLEDPTHAQHGLARLLKSLRLHREDIEDLSMEEARSSSSGRAAFLSQALRPAMTTDRWQTAAPPSDNAIARVQRLDCLDPQAEAQTIALLLREALETKDKTAVLITPDRDLSRRVAAELLRWDIEVDDSAGTSLDQSPPGVFLRLVANLFAENASPIALLALLKHPFSSMGHAPEQFRRHVRALEKTILRGPAPAAGFDGLVRTLDAVSEARTDVDYSELQIWLKILAELATPVEALSNQTEIGLKPFLTEFIRFSEQLSVSEEGKSARLWEGVFGEAAAGFVSELLRASDVIEGFSASAWPELLDILMTGRMVRRPYGGHPRLQIWGPIEGRLQRADLVVMGGLNDGVWPPDAGNDPWMSRPMRQEFKLPLPEQRLGLSAHDFQQAFCSSQVVLTRAEKVEGTPTVPSRWLLRLETLLKKFGLNMVGEAANTAITWQSQLDQPKEYKPVAPPRPTPPVSARPRQLSVTRIEKWLKDPYSIFAESILNLRPLADIAEDPGAADRGNFIHEALERFILAYPREFPQDPRGRLLEIGEEAFGDVLNYPAVWAFWWPRFERIADWFIEFERIRRTSYSSLAVEAKGKITIAAPHDNFVLSGTADRIDRREDGSLAILDYKTGVLPSVREVETGMAPQLALEASMILHKGFAGLPAGPVSELSYIRLSGGDPPGFLRPAGKDIPAEELAEAAYEGLQRLIVMFDKQATPYLSLPRPDIPGRFNDYEHLARVKEWSDGEVPE